MNSKGRERILFIYFFVLVIAVFVCDKLVVPDIGGTVFSTYVQ